MAYDGSLKFDTKIDSSGFQKGISAIGDIAQKGLQATGAILKGSMAAIGGLGAAAVKVGSDFESGMSKVAAISGASGQELAELTEKAKYMGSTTKFSATESAAAFEYMAMAGWKTGDMLDGIEGIMNLAAASGEDLATTSDIVTDALTAFGMKASDAGHFSDILAQASSNANTNVGMMGETFKYVAPVAGALGYTAEDTAMAIGLMANAGIKSSQAGTSLRSMMSRLTKPTKEVQNAMNTLGVSLTNSDGSMKSLNEVMKDLRDGFNGLSEAESAELASSLAGQEAMSGLLAIVNSSDDDFNKLERSIYNCDGAAARMAETMSNNLQGQITILKSGLEGLGISLYENMQAPCMEIVKEAQTMVQELQEAFDNGGLDSLVTTFGSILSRIVEKVAGAAPDLINAATGLVSSFCQSLKSSSPIGDAASSLITSLITVFFSGADDIWTAAVVMAGRMAEGLAEGAPEMVQAIATCITDIFECLSEWAPDFVDAGVRIIGSLAQGLAETLPVILQHGIDIVLELGRGIAESIPTLLPLAIDCILSLIDTFISNIDSVIDIGIEIIMAIADGLIQSLPILIERIPDIILKILEAFDRNFEKIANSGIDLILALVKGIISAIPVLIKNIPQILEAIVQTVSHFSFLDAGKKIIQSIVDGIREAGSLLGQAILEMLPKLVEKVGEWGSQLYEKVSENVSRCVNSISTWFSELPEKISFWLLEVIARVIAWGQEMLTTAGNAVSSVINNIADFFAELPNTIAYWLGYAIGTVIKWGSDLYNWVITEVPHIIDEIAVFFSELPGKVWTWLVDTVNKVVQWGVNLLSTASSAAQNAVNKVNEWFQQLPGKIWVWLTNTITKVTQFAVNLAAKASSAAQGFVTNLVDGVKGLPDKFQEIGSNIVNGIWNGISAGWSWLVDKVKSLAESLYQGAKDALGIESPSKVFAREVGRWIPPGIGAGVEKAMPDLQKQMDAEMDGLAKRMQTAVAVETGGITVRTRANAEHNADKEYPKSGGDTYIDNHIDMKNDYHVPVVTPSESQKADREAARKLLGGLQ